MQYRQEIDGLRAVAVLPVILFHAGLSVFSGGYVGVDVFFVISGYLITGILIAELERGDFSIARFYERRARRILPALFVVMLACLPLAYLWMPPTQMRDFSESLMAVVLFASNILFWRQEGYFAAAAELKPLLHTWSLAVEEQYYLLFPLFLLLLWRFGRRRAFLSVIAIAATSLLLAEWGWRNSPNANFYLAPTRAWELLAGSICAFLAVGRMQRSSNALSSAGLAMIVFAIFFYDAQTPFPSIYTLLPVLGTALIILFAAQGTWVARLLSLRPVVGLGLISYSAYLWHQPLFAFARIRSFTEPSHLLMGSLSVLALLLAWATWRYVEQPFRRRPNPTLATRRSVFAASGALGVLFFAVGFAGYASNGFDFRSGDGRSLAELEARIAVNHGLHSDCEGAFNTSENCRTSARPEVLLWGDSFAMHLAQGIVASGDAVALQQHTTSSCAPILGLAQLGADATMEWAEGCIAFNNSVLGWLGQTGSVELVILASPFDGVLDGRLLLEDGTLLAGDQIEAVAQSLKETVRKIRETGARVVVVSPTPRSGWDSGQCLMRSAYFVADEAVCDFPLDLDTRPFELLRSVESNVAVYWLHKDICPNAICDAMQSGVFIFRDTGHLSKEGSAYLGRQNAWMDRFRDMAN